MTMTKEEFRNEYLYNMTMVHVKNLLKKGLVTKEEYWQINAKFKEKYNPVSDGLLSENELLCTGKRA